MKLMIASDIHGSALWAEKLLAAFEREHADRLLLLGDLLYHGPRNDLPEGYAPKAVIPLLNGMKERIWCVRGNCEAEVDQMVLSFPVMADYCALLMDGHVLYATHGHVYGEDNPPPLMPGDVLLCGHTHGGQIRLFGKSILDLSRQEQRYLSGWNTETGQPILTTTGVGCETVNIRLGSTPEVWLITLRRA